MYAVIQTGGKQYKVNEGDILKVEKLAGEAGDKLTLDQILILSDGNGLKIGSPLVSGATAASTTPPSPFPPSGFSTGFLRNRRKRTRTGSPSRTARKS